MEGFAEFLIKTPAVKFGDFTLKSGRKSKYFVNFGEIYKPKELIFLGEFYAKYLIDLDDIEYENCYGFGVIDAIFGPPYKGINIAIAMSCALCNNYSISIPFVYNRKIQKNHGEKGDFIGVDISKLNRVLIVDDVFTDGATKLETIGLLKHTNPNIIITGILVGVDRQEIYGSDAIPMLRGKTCKDVFEKMTSVKVHSLTDRDELLKLRS